MKKQAGFTLIELIIVIVILGILAAYAVPKYIHIDKEARAAVVKALFGSVRSASDMVHATAVANGKSANATDTVDIGGGATVAIAKGYATATLPGIVEALADITDFDIDVDAATNTVTLKHKGAKDPAKCSVSYKYDSSATNAVPTIKLADPSDCT